MSAPSLHIESTDSMIYRAKCWLPFSNLHFHVIVAHDIAAEMGRVHTCTDKSYCEYYAMMHERNPSMSRIHIGSTLVALLALCRDFLGIW